ncbi:hypothetical protein JG687_00018015, partial [Phytophthora cactorum]
DKWRRRQEADPWTRGQQSQKPKQLWAHKNVLTDYQVWVTYRLATQQLNLYYDGRQRDDGCLLDEHCHQRPETITHIVWTCQRAQAYWRTLLQHWLGREICSEDMTMYHGYFSARVAPPVGNLLRRRLTMLYGGRDTEYEVALRRIWWAFCSIAYAMLWELRNQVVHDQKKWTRPQHLDAIWTGCFRQLSAVASKESKTPSTRIQGWKSRLIDCLTSMEGEASSSDEPQPPPPPWLCKQEMVLLKRLRLYQEANN